MKRIGILGGISSATTIDYYSRIMTKYRQSFNDNNYPEVLIYSLSHGKSKNLEDTGQKDKYISYLGEGVKSLVNGGADFIALAANSPHSVIEELKSGFDIPFVSALESAYNESLKKGFRKALLLGIKYTMKSDFYHKRFLKGGIELISPREEEMNLVNDIIFNKLLDGKEMGNDTRDQILNIINNYVVDGVVLGCMRLPVFFNEETVPDLNLVNTLDRHIEDILDFGQS